MTNDSDLKNDAASDIEEPDPILPQMSILEAIPIVIKNANHHEGVEKGVRQVVKALDRDIVQICFLASDCDEETYAMCTEKKVPLIMVETGKTLGKWCGLCRLDKEGNARKIVKCSSAVITDFGEDSEALKILLDYIKTK